MSEPKSAGIKTPSREGPIAVKNEGASNENLVISSKEGKILNLKAILTVEIPVPL